MINAPYLRGLGFFAILGGGARILSSFIPWTGESAPLEAFYFGIDLCLLFGLMGFYSAIGAKLGLAGFAGFLIAASGVAFITGPDGVAFGVDIYNTGVAIIAAGLAILSAMLLIRRIARSAALLWLTAIAASIIGGALGHQDLGFTISGVAFGAAFVAAGIVTMREASSA